MDKMILKLRHVLSELIYIYSVEIGMIPFMPDTCCCDRYTMGTVLKGCKD